MDANLGLGAISAGIHRESGGGVAFSRQSGARLVCFGARLGVSAAIDDGKLIIGCVDRDWNSWIGNEITPKTLSLTLNLALFAPSCAKGMVFAISCSGLSRKKS